MLLDTYNAQECSHSKDLPGTNGNRAVVEKPCFKSIHLYNTQNNPTVIIFAIIFAYRSIKTVFHCTVTHNVEMLGIN